MKFNLKNVKRIVAVGVASLALIIPLAGNGASVQASSHHSLRYYEKCLDDDNTLDYSNFDNNSDDSLTTVRMKLLIRHPALKHTINAKWFFEETLSWGSDDWNYYAHHYKQLYSPYLKNAMPKRDDEYSGSQPRHNDYLIYRARKQLGLLSHHHNKRVHHIKRRKVNHHKRTRRHVKRNVRHRKHHFRKGHRN